MRDIGTLVWVVLVFIGVIGSMVSSVRKQVQAQPGPRYRTLHRPPPPQFEAQAPPPAPPPVPQSQAIVRSPPTASRVPAPAQAHPADEPHPAQRRRLFAHRNDLVRGIIAAEVLGKPRALRDEDFPR
jgi:hypothetical protein